MRDYELIDRFIQHVQWISERVVKKNRYPGLCSKASLVLYIDYEIFNQPIYWMSWLISETEQNNPQVFLILKNWIEKTALC